MCLMPSILFLLVHFPKFATCFGKLLQMTWKLPISYLCLLPESSPMANGVVIDSLLSRLR